jgi:hypothetical protein
MTVSLRRFVTGGRLLAAVLGLGISATLAGAQPPAPGSPAGPGEVRDRPESGEEPAREGRRNDDIETDRDSFTPATSTVARGRVIVESAYTFLDNRRVPETHSFPELLLRSGVTERMEMRLGWNCEIGGARTDTSGSLGGADLSGGGVKRDYRMSYGMKMAMTEQEGWVPASVMIMQGFTPMGGSATATQMVATYAWGWELPNRWKCDMAFRYGTNSEAGDRFEVFAPSAVLKVPVGENWNVHAEYFALFSSNKEHDFVVHYLSPGMHYLVTPDLEVGVRLGWGLNDQAARFFINAGVGLRF